MENAAFWERMYAANIGRMIGACHRYVNDLALAEDLAHEAFLKAMERADTYRATGNFEAWLMRITVNHAIQHLRQSMDTVPRGTARSGATTAGSPTHRLQPLCH